MIIVKESRCQVTVEILEAYCNCTQQRIVIENTGYHYLVLFTNLDIFVILTLMEHRQNLKAIEQHNGKKAEQEQNKNKKYF